MNEENQDKVIERAVDLLYRLEECLSEQHEKNSYTIAEVFSAVGSFTTKVFTNCYANKKETDIYPKFERFSCTMLLAVLERVKYLNGNEEEEKAEDDPVEGSDGSGGE